MGAKFTGMNHDEELHQGIVDITRGGGLDDEDILIPNGLSKSDTGFLIGV